MKVTFKNPKICSKCVMDSTALEIKFDNNGVCSFCKEYDIRSSKDLHESPEDSKKLEEFSLVITLKKTGLKDPVINLCIDF